MSWEHPKTALHWFCAAVVARIGWEVGGAVLSFLGKMLRHT